MSNEKTSIRRQSRELALQVLFQRQFSGEISPEDGLNHFKQSFHFSPQVWKYAKTLLDGVAESQEQIDQAISSLSQNWSPDRMALVDLSLLRMAVFEMKWLKEADPQVIINEAIEISKKYGGTDSHQFINGLLGQLIEAST